LIFNLSVVIISIVVWFICEQGSTDIIYSDIFPIVLQSNTVGHLLGDMSAVTKDYSSRLFLPAGQKLFLLKI
jgi:hypothetical protein